MWVLAPHPDDEVLMAGESISARLAAGDRIEVYVATNGDLGCGRDGHRRQEETVRALAALGLPEAHVHFLGYPDGHLARLGQAALEPMERRDRSGGCGLATGTYAERGAGRVEVHRARTGEAGPYTRTSIIDDLVDSLRRDRPDHVLVAHPFDEHPDHATTYVLLREALERAALDPPPVLHRAMVHAGPCWPDGAALEGCLPVRASLGTPMPPLPGPLAPWSLGERLPVADGGARKREVLALYRSQLETSDPADDWLSAFGRADEVFEEERLLLGPGRRHARAGSRLECTHLMQDGTTLELAPAPPDDALGIVRVGCGPAALTLTATGLQRVLPLPAGGLAGEGCQVQLVRLGPEQGSLGELEVRRGGELRALWPWPSRSRAVEGGRERERERERE